jgi:hypothetical protein
MFSACQEGALWVLCIFVSHPLEGSSCLLMGKPSGLHLLDEHLEDFIVNPAGLPWKWLKRLAASGERINHGSWWKCTTHAECKIGISAVLMVTISLGPLWNSWSLMIIMFILFIIHVYLIMCLCGLVINLFKANRSKSVSTIWASWTPCYIAEYDMYLRLLYFSIL